MSDDYRSVFAGFALTYLGIGVVLFGQAGYFDKQYLALFAGVFTLIGAFAIGTLLYQDLQAGLSSQQGGRRE